MTTYYFLAAALPELQIGEPPEISFHVLSLLLKWNLSRKDLQYTEVLRRLYDILNIRAFWRGEPLDEHGTMNENDLEEALLTGSGFPEYVYEFLDRYADREERLNAFSRLLFLYFKREKEHANPFLRNYLQFEWEWRLVVMALRAKLYEKEVALELQEEGQEDELIGSILAQKDAKHFEPPVRLISLKTLFMENYGRPEKLHQALCEYRFKHIEKMYGIEVLGEARIFAYMMQLILVEEWLELDKKKGLSFIDERVKEV